MSYVDLNNAFLLVSMKEMICRLCLQTIGNNNCQPVEESVLKFLKLNINVSNENVMCVECAHRLRVFSNFTPVCAYMEDKTLPLSDLDNGVKLEPEPIETTSNPKSLMKTEIKCSFCTKTHGREDLTSLQISREHKFLLEQYISEADLKNTKELLTCESCLGSLEGVWSIILKCLEVEEKISKYIELKGTDDKGRIELKEVQQFMFGPTIKSEIEPFGVDKLEDITDQVQEEYNRTAEAEIKYGKGISNAELIIKKEDDDTESESSNCDIAAIKSKQIDGFQEIFTKDKCPSKMKMFQCEFCSHRTKWKSALAIHVSWIHKKYKCELCLYETKHKSHLEHHSLTHKNPSEIKKFKCEMCSYEAKRETYLKKHLLLTHKNSSEVNRFKCELCSYEAKYKCQLEDHLLTHKSPSEIKMFKCEICSYETKRERNLKKHLLTHKSPSEIKIFKCVFCSHEAKQKSNLKSHLLTHRNPSERKMFKCEMCSYEAKQKRSLKNHLLTHNSPS